MIVIAPELHNHARMLRGFQIRLARLALGWSQQQLADRARLGINTVQRAEHADVPSITASNLFAIQRALETEGITFLDENETSLGGGPGLRFRHQHDG